MDQPKQLVVQKEYNSIWWFYEYLYITPYSPILWGVLKGMT
jgi:hypothetical protein